MKRAARLWIAVAALLALGASLRPVLEAWRRELALAIVVPEDVPEELRGGEASPAVALIGSSMGVFRPLVINFLWLRSSILQREGRFFESAALARFITMLQPRLPVMWTFWAHNLAYNISAEVPREDRYHWVLEGISLIRDRALAGCPASSSLYAELAYIFLHKIGFDLDDAHAIYQESLARTFEPPDGLPEDGLHAWRLELRAEWKIDPQLLAELSARYLGGAAGGAELELDLRAPEAHALYWLDVGRAVSRPGEDTPGDFRLRQYRILALQRLLSRGRIVRQPGGTLHAHLPDDRWLAAAHAALLEEIERYSDRPELAAQLDDWLDLLHADAAFALRLWSRTDEALRWFARIRPEDSGGLEATIAASLARGDDGDPRAERRRTGAAASILLKASICLSLVEESDVSGLEEGMGDLGGWMLSDWNHRRSDAPLPSPLDVRRALARDLHARLADRPELRGLAERLRERLPAEIWTGDDPPEGVLEE
ncbi:MAG: hypothetical protein JXA90_13325, partial [Planctomycetes bacterium]|nr:hypothetical protein [Planctomycetota bacterium]